MTVLLIVEPLKRNYRVRLQTGEILVDNARTPFFSAARELLRRGYDPAMVLEARHKSETIVALRSTIGAAAKLTVLETDSLGPVVRRWRPFVGVTSRPRTGDDG